MTRGEGFCFDIQQFDHQAKLGLYQLHRGIKYYITFKINQLMVKNLDKKIKSPTAHHVYHLIQKPNHSIDAKLLY